MPKTIYYKIKHLDKDGLADFILNEFMDARKGCEFCPIRQKLYQGYDDCPSNGSDEQCLKEVYKYLDFKED